MNSECVLNVKYKNLLRFIRLYLEKHHGSAQTTVLNILSSVDINLRKLNKKGIKET